MYAAIKKRTKQGWLVQLVSNEGKSKNYRFTINGRTPNSIRVIKEQLCKTESQAENMFLGFCQEAGNTNREQFNQRTKTTEQWLGFKQARI